MIDRVVRNASKFRAIAKFREQILAATKVESEVESEFVEFVLSVETNASALTKIQTLMEGRSSIANLRLRGYRQLTQLTQLYAQSFEEEAKLLEGGGSGGGSSNSNSNSNAVTNSLKQSSHLAVALASFEEGDIRKSFQFIMEGFNAILEVCTNIYSHRETRKCI
jgi:hypothetical protein